MRRRTPTPSMPGQHQVEQDEGRADPRQGGQGLGAVAGLLDLEAGVLQEPRAGGGGYWSSSSTSRIVERPSAAVAVGRDAAATSGGRADVGGGGRAGRSR